jgi:hypothetical protein
MRRSWIGLALIVFVGVAAVGDAAAGESSGVRGIIWLQPAYGVMTGDFQVTGEVPTEVRMTGIPIIGSVSADLPVTGEVEFGNPAGIVLGGEVIFGRFGLEVNAAYVSRAATARGSMQVCGGLLSGVECDILEAFGIPVPADTVVEEEIDNLAVTLGVNYHFADGGKWDIWVGPMIAWSMWGEYDFSDARIELSATLESLLQGTVDEFELAGNESVAPEDTVTFGASLGGRYEFATAWSVVGGVRYFLGDEVVLPGGSGNYSMLSFSVGVARSFGG